MISWNDFEKIDMRVGRIIEVHDFPKARKPAFKLTIDFGELGLSAHPHRSLHCIQKKVY